MANPSITYLLLDGDYDPVFTPSSQLTDADAVRQAVETRLRLFLGEWWENLNLGLPVFQSILGKLGTQRGQQAINLAIVQQIRGVPYVTSVRDISSQFVAGTFSFRATVETSFGAITVSTNPGDEASLDT